MINLVFLVLSFLRKVWVLAEPPHVEKRLRNNLLDHGITTSRGGLLNSALMRAWLRWMGRRCTVFFVTSVCRPMQSPIANNTSVPYAAASSCCYRPLGLVAPRRSRGSGGSGGGIRGKCPSESWRGYLMHTCPPIQTYTENIYIDEITKKKLLENSFSSPGNNVLLLF